MTNIKEKLLEVLRMKDYSYSDLATNIGMTEPDLDDAIENNTLEVRTLELISKELRIPLYSFFRENFNSFDFEKEPFYNVNIWSKEEEEKEENGKLSDLNALRKEIETLRAAVNKKDQLINELESKIQKR